MNEETKTTATETAPDAEQVDVQETAKTFTQAEVDTLIKERLARQAKNQPSKEELDAYRAWQETQKSEAERQQEATKALASERDAATAERDRLQLQVAALGKGVPADRLTQYVQLALTYVDDDTDFTAGLDKALQAFPIASGGVPGAGGNPPKAEPNTKKKPQGTVVF